MSKAPPVLHFDDGSRVMTESQTVMTSKQELTPALLNPRKQTPIEIYYEIDRVSTEIVQSIVMPKYSSTSMPPQDGFLCKVALQFPDELLPDAHHVAWLIEDSVLQKYNAQKQSWSQKHDENGNLDDNEFNNNGGDDAILVPLIFVLGDTTYSSCCPDEIGAHHLSADVIVHFGQYACLSVSDTLPVIYSFGMQEWDGIEQCFNAIINQIEESSTGGSGVEKENERIILVCERRYHHHMNKLAESLTRYGVSEVVVGTVPLSQASKKQSFSFQSCCQGPHTECNTGNKNARDKYCQTSQSECRNDEGICAKPEGTSNIETIESGSTELLETNPVGCIIGGLHVRIPPSALTEYRIIFVGDDSGYAESRQFLNTMLKYHSQTKAIWSFNPSTCLVSIDPNCILGVSRYLNRRFYLTQKAKMTQIMGILVGTLSQERFRTVVASVRQKIEASGRACYTFVVGKINVAKLANFAEVECFVLVSCGETSILRDEREFHVPVITPTELEIALGEKEWGGSASCNTDFGDFLQNHHEGGEEGTVAEEDEEGGEHSDCDEDDEPFFSMISGTYVSKPMSLKSQRKSQQCLHSSDLEALPGQGQMTEYKSEAAEFWKKREYKGLEAHIGKDEAKAATEGQTGIASDYGK